MNQRINEIKNAHNLVDFIDYDKRIYLLRKLKDYIIANENDILDALKKDLNKSDSEAFLCEVNVVIREIDYHLKHLKKWMKPIRVKSNIETFLMKSYIWYKPKGKVLIISPFNYPFNLTIMPLIGAISAGNCVLIKMSNEVIYTKTIVYQILNNVFNGRIVNCIDKHDLNNYDEIFEYQPNLVFFTGSTKIGKEIEQKCLARNIEYITEMGGQCPCIVYDIHSKTIYERIIWSKFLNAGQTCVSINYILFNKNISDFTNNLVDSLKLQLAHIYQNHSFGKIINQKSFNHLVDIINEHQENIIYGGHYDSDNLIIEPTIIKLTKKTDLKKYGELFGPILFIYALDNNFDEYIDLVNEIDASPLAAYLFSDIKNNRKLFIEKINAGGYGINDCISQILNHHLPFGGVYTSGFGSYHGKYSFESFSFRKPILVNDLKKDIQIKYFNHNNLGYKKIKKYLTWIKRILFFK